MTDYGPQPGYRRYATIIIPGIYGNHVPYKSGQGVTTPNIEPGIGRHATTGNAALTLPTGELLWLWVNEVEVGFELGGTTAQSRRQRQFFPHNFSQVKMTVRGTAPNNYQYNRIASFVRMSQYWALYAEDFAKLQQNQGQSISNLHYADGTALQATQLILRGNTEGNVIPNGKTIKGPNRPWKVWGYIKNIKAGASRFEYATDFEFEFEITESHNGGKLGIFDDHQVVGQKIMSWMDVFQRNHFQGVDSKTPSSTPIDLVNSLLDFVGSL
jgi:hypothetical protein